MIYKIPVIGIPLAPVLIILISTVVYLRKEKIKLKEESEEHA